MPGVTTDEPDKALFSVGFVEYLALDADGSQRALPAEGSVAA
jgi:hypothetical protein